MNHFDLAVAGAGISGLSIAFAASKKGLRTIILDSAGPGSGASGAPLALLNPATGRRAKKAPSADLSLPYTKDLLERVQQETGRRVYSRNGVVRPALDEKMAFHMNETLEKSDWNSQWVRWLNREELQKRFEGLQCHSGGLWISAAATVSLQAFIKALAAYLQSGGVQFCTGQPFGISPDGTISIPGSRDLFAEQIVHATGSGLTESPLWDTLPLHRVKGQLLAVRLSSPLPFHSSVSALGYIAQTGGSCDIVIGSTYEHHYQHPHPDSDGAGYLLNRLERVLPGLRKRVTYQRGWAGVRVTTPDKKPVIGRHPAMDNHFILGGLGSKGLMLGPYMGLLLSNHLTEGTALPKKYDVQRFY